MRKYRAQEEFDAVGFGVFEEPAGFVLLDDLVLVHKIEALAPGTYEPPG